MEMFSHISDIISWMLIHSIWIFAGAMVLIKSIGLLIRKPFLKGRIKLLVLLFSLGAVCTIAVWRLDDQPAPEIGILLPEGSGLEIMERDWIQQMEVWISSNSSLISLIWLAGFAISLIRYYLGHYQIQQIKQYSQVCVDPVILDLVKKISQRLSIGSHLEIRISSLINSPLTTGWIKPIVYLPISMSAGFTVEEIDSILYHELTHVKHRDYLVNLVLVGVETLFFFNPFVLMIISDLRNEMEYACDDRVIKHTSKTTYVQALLKLQELRISNSLGLAAKGNNSEFIKRINKMMNKTNNSSEKGKLIPGLIICLFIAASIVGSAFIGKEESTEKSTHVQNNTLQQDTIKVTSKEELGRKIKNLSKDQFASTVFMLDGKEVPVISGENLDKGETMMKHIKKELVRDGILSPDNKRVKLMFQYSDLLNGKDVLGDKYEKYKKIFNTYFPVYDSYATTRVFKYDK